MTPVLAQFIHDHQGESGFGDTPQNAGQCVGLVERWLDLLGQPHIWGNACDLPANASPFAYTITENEPTNFPVPGDIVVFPAGWGGSEVGHCALVTEANVNSFTVFEQNDRIGGGDGSCRLWHFDRYYNGMSWIHPKVLDVPVNLPDPAPDPTPVQPEPPVENPVVPEPTPPTPQPPTPPVNPPVPGTIVEPVPVPVPTSPSPTQIPRIDSLSRLPEPLLVRIAADEKQAINWLGTTLGGLTLKLLGAGAGWLFAQFSWVQANDVATSIVGLVIGSAINSYNNPNVPNTTSDTKK